MPNVYHSIISKMLSNENKVENMLFNIQIYLEQNAKKGNFATVILKTIFLP